MLSFLQEQIKPFERSCLVANLLVLAGSSTQMKHMLPYAIILKRWLQLGGHCDGDSNIYVAMKEAQKNQALHNCFFGNL